LEIHLPSPKGRGAEGEGGIVGKFKPFTKPDTREKFLVECKESAAQQYVLQFASGPAAEDEDRHAAKLLAVMLGDDSGSRLYWELVDPGLAEQATLNHAEYQRAGMMATFMSCDPERIEDNLQILRDIYRRAESDGVTEEELAQAKSKVRSHLVSRKRASFAAVCSPSAAIGSIAAKYRPLESEMKTFAEVGLNEVNAVLAKIPPHSFAPP